LPIEAEKAAILSPVLPALKEGLIEVRAPMLGRFFRASSPSEPPYVEISVKVVPEDTICMIEVMKLFSTVKAGVSGTIVEILVENGVMVEHDTVLFLVRPE
jgi:acetyl-CoA carboxylase biotin carboxyl carrier protein